MMLHNFPIANISAWESLLRHWNSSCSFPFDFRPHGVLLLLLLKTETEMTARRRHRCHTARRSTHTPMRSVVQVWAKHGKVNKSLVSAENKRSCYVTQLCGKRKHLAEPAPRNHHIDTHSNWFNLKTRPQTCLYSEKYQPEHSNVKSLLFNNRWYMTETWHWAS